MSTYLESLYRPMKISDILDLGFEIDNDHEFETTKQRIRISADKIQRFISCDYDTVFSVMRGETIESRDYYYLWMNEIIERRGHKCVWFVGRYGANSPALSHLSQGLHHKGYKLKIEGERYNYNSEIEYQQKNLEFIEKLLADKNI